MKRKLQDEPIYFYSITLIFKFQKSQINLHKTKAASCYFPRINSTLIILKNVLHCLIKKCYLICQNTWQLILWNSWAKSLLQPTNIAQLHTLQFISSPRNHLVTAGTNICLWKHFVEKCFPMKNFRYN